MAQFTRRPPIDADPPPLPLIRVGPTTALQALITSTDLVGCHTHYWRGRTIPCQAARCPACQDGMSSRWHAWIGIFGPKTGRLALLELTALATERIAAYYDDHDTIRGAKLTASRPSKKINGRLHVEIEPANLAAIDLPPAPNVIAQLAKIWNVPLSELSAPDQPAAPAVIHHDPPHGNGRPRVETIREILGSQNDPVH